MIHLNSQPLAPERNHTILPRFVPTVHPLSFSKPKLNMHMSISAAAVLAAMLVLTGLVSAPDVEKRQLEFFDNSLIQDLDESEMGPEKALALMDSLCSQQRDELGRVSGAINVKTWTFMTWQEYQNGPGEGQDLNPWYAAHGEWNTFRGHCFFHQYSAWYEDGITSKSEYYHQYGDSGGTRKIIIFVDTPGFSAETSLPSLMAQVRDQPTDLVPIFDKLVGLPESIRKLWVGLSTFVEPRKTRMDLTGAIPACSTGWMTATTVERFVRVRQVFEVEHFYYNSDGNSGAVNSWLERGFEWKFVTSSGAWIDGHGVAKQTPEERSYYHVQMQSETISREVCMAQRRGRKSKSIVDEL
jgi:hypothetical protein